jgi:hypothetical protein
MMADEVDGPAFVGAEGWLSVFQIFPRDDSWQTWRIVE